MPSSLNGTGLTFNSGATLNSPPVTSIATGNGLQGGTITTTGTLSIAAPSFNSVGSYVWAFSNVSATAGSNYSAGANLQSVYFDGASLFSTNNLSGTWKSMGGGSSGSASLFCRVS